MIDRLVFMGVGGYLPARLTYPVNSDQESSEEG